MQTTLTIEHADNLLFALGLSETEFSREAKFLLAAKLYEMGKLSSGQAARLADQSRVEFLLSLPRVGVATSNLRQEDLENELKFARNG